MKVLAVPDTATWGVTIGIVLVIGVISLAVACARRMPWRGKRIDWTRN